MKIRIALFLAVAFASCQRPVPNNAFWSGQLQRSDKKTIPFRAFVNLDTQPPSGYFLVGDERTPIPEIVRTGDSLTFVFSEYNAAMRGVLDGPKWRGEYLRYRSTTMSIPFVAEADSPERLQMRESARSAIPLVGKFQAFLDQNGSTDSTTVATFWMKGDSIYGTLIAPDGDYGLNVGAQRGTIATLSRFTGWQAQLFEFRQAGDSWNGTLVVRDDPATTLTLAPRPSLRPEVASNRITTMTDRNRPFSFSGITDEGDTLSDLSPQFRGKALIIDIMGTWCHNCMDESPILQQVYSEFKEKGLVVVGLSFEINDNPEQARKNLRLYRQRYDLTYPLLFCGSTEEKYVGPKLRAQMANFYAYPTALFIDKNGIVRTIHIGFKGPGTGEEFQTEVNNIYGEVKHITGM